MLEPDNTIHREIRVEPDKDAGGLADMNPHFGTPIIDHCTAKAQKLKPGFKWEYTGSGIVCAAFSFAAENSCLAPYMYGVEAA